MADVIDKTTRLPVQVPDAELATKWKAGEVGLIPGKEYQVKLPDGKYRAVSAEEMPEALGHPGVQTVSPDEAQAALDESQFGGAGNAAFAGALGAASQLTGGLSDQALMWAARLDEANGGPKGFAQSLAHASKTVKELHPVATGLGEVGGIALQNEILPGGGFGGAAERGALALTGEAAEGAASRLAQRAFVAGARGAAEGQQFDTAQAVSDNAFTDHALTAAHVLGSIGGPNALWGGALGAGFGALGGAFRRGEPVEKGVLETALARQAPKAEDIETVAARQFGDDVAPGLGEKAADFHAKAMGLLGHDPEAIRKLHSGAFDPESEGAKLRALIHDGDAARDDLAREFTEHLNDFAKESKPFASPEGLALKKSYVADAVKGLDKSAAGDAAISLADTIGKKIDTMALDPETYGDVAGVKRLARMGAEHQSNINHAVAEGRIADAYLDLDQWKRAIGKPKAKLEHLLSPAGGGGGGLDEYQLQSAMARKDLYGEMHDALRTGLEDTSAWGRLGEQQHAVNSRWFQQIAYAKEFRAALTTRYGIDPENPWLKDVIIDPGKAEAYLRNLTSPSKDLIHRSVMGYLDNTVALGQSVLDRGSLTAAEAANVRGAVASAEKTKETLAKTADLISAQNQFARIKEASAKGLGAMSSLAGAAGFLMHGPVGGLAGLVMAKAARLAVDPAQTIIHLATMERMVRKSDGRIARALRDFASGDARTARSLDVTSYARKTAAVGEMMSSPDKLAERIGTNLGDLRTRAPRLADAMTGTALTAIQFLHGKLPPALPGDPFDAKRAPPLPPPGVRESWLRYYDAVEDPVSVVEDLRDGRINPEGVETLKAVYPQLFQSVRAQAFDRMASGKLADLTKQQRIGLSLALDIPIPELDPAYIRARQAAYAAPGAESPPPGGGPGKRPAKIDLQKSTPTLTVDRLEAGPQP